MNEQEQTAYRIALEAGMMPADIEAALHDAAAADQQLPTEAEIAEDARITEADIERDKLWWFYNSAVPPEYKRLLTAIATERPHVGQA
jgi:hypothetical protein